MSSSKTSQLLEEKLKARNPIALKQEQQRVLINPVDILNQQEPNSRTNEHLNTRTPEQMNKRTGERMNKRPPEREIKRQSFDIFLDQYHNLLHVKMERTKKLKREVTLGELAQEAFDMFLTFERTKEHPNK